MDVEALNRRILLFGDQQKRALVAEKRDVLHSELFDVRRRSLLGWYAHYKAEAPFLRELLEHTTPEEIGQAMRFPGMRPYSMQPFLMAAGYLGARQQEMAAAGLDYGEPWADENVEDLALVMEVWERIMLAYRRDGFVVPEQADGALRILDDDVLADVADRLRPVEPERDALVRRTMATLELYAFMLHGEHRDGIAGHGPYQLEDGSTLYFKELNDLRNDYLPWAVTPTRNALGNLVVAYAARDVQVHNDLFGSMTVIPHEPGDRVHSIAVMTNDAGTLRTVEAEELEQVLAAATEAQNELYMELIGWEDSYRVAYGAPLYANHLLPLFDPAGLAEEVGPRIMAAYEAIAAEYVPRLLADEGLVLQGQAVAAPALFWPVA